MSQPLVSQHLRSLRQGGLVRAVRHSKEVTYAITDTHVTHVMTDALAHVLGHMAWGYSLGYERGV